MSPRKDLFGVYILRSQTNAGDFLRAMGAPEAYVAMATSEVIGEEQFQLKEAEDGQYEMGDPARG